VIHVCPKCNGEKKLDEDRFSKLCSCDIEKQHKMLSNNTINFCRDCKVAIYQERRPCPTCDAKGFVKS